MRYRLILLNFLCSFSICFAQIAGPWHGSVDLGVQTLPIVFNINEVEGTYSATMDSPLQGATDIPADISVKGDTIDITIPLIGAKYHGRLAEGAIEGELTQHGVGLALTLEPGEYVPPRPQTPQPPYPYEIKEVTIVNPADGYVLHGTLTLPLQYMVPTKTFNAVVMVTGSGLQNRDEEIYGHRPFAVIAHNLAMNGVASLRYDDRGYDQPTDATDMTTATNASDAKAAVDYLRSSVGRLNKIGVLGHSEGGTIALMLGADGSVDFVVSLAGAAVRGDSILLKQNQQVLIRQLGEKLTNDYLQGLRLTLDFMEHNPGAKEWPGMEAALAHLALPAQLVENLASIIKVRNAWMDYFISHDPTEMIKGVNVPVYGANGSLDVQVDSNQNLGALRALLPQNPSSVIKEYLGLNHLMQEATTGLTTEYGEIEQTISPQLLYDVTRWIKKLK